jgi:hypothetical protein
MTEPAPGGKEAPSGALVSDGPFQLFAGQSSAPLRDCALSA